MSGFTDPLLVSPLADGATWVVMRPFGYDVGAEGSGDRIDVEIGFMTDFASVPRLLRAVLPVWGKYGNASVIHDWLYWTQRRTRAEADRILLEAMGVLQVDPLTRRAIYGAVRAFGWIAWMRNQADRRAGFRRVLRPLNLTPGMESPRMGTAERLRRAIVNVLTIADRRA